MSANFWQSSQRQHWQFSKQELESTREKMRLYEKGVWKFDDPFPSATDPNIRLFIHSLILMLGRQLSVRQRVIATAELYITRFFTKVSILEVNVYLLVAACMYVACKTEECSQHIRTISAEARALWPEFITHDATKIAECEFYLIEELETYLIVHHPYRALMELSQSLTDSDASLNLNPEELQSAWGMINDSYATDLLLLYPPHVTATACVYITIVLKSPHVRPAKPPEKIKARIDRLAQYLGDSGIDLVKVTEAVQEMISLYARWEKYDEAKCRAKIAKQLLAFPHPPQSRGGTTSAGTASPRTGS